MSQSEVPVVILCGGRGRRFQEQTQYRPKPMIEIGTQPMLWHIMKTYAQHGFREFVLCLGYKGELIKEYFLNYRWLTNDITVDLGTNEIEIIGRSQRDDWRVTLVDTGYDAKTGARVKRIEPYVRGERFMLTYGDGVTNLDIGQLLQFHRSHGCVGTVTGVAPVSQYGELTIRDDSVVSFREKPARDGALISGGYFVFEREFFDYLEDDDECVLERAPLQQLTDAGQLRVNSHHDFWQCMDTARDYEYLTELWDSGRAPWRIWRD